MSDVKVTTAGNRVRVDVSALDEQIADLTEALKGILQSQISSGSGPIAPCFDAEDYEVERTRGAWVVIDAKAIERARATLDKARGTSPLPRKPPQRASILKPQPFRSLRYRQWIKSLPSAVSGLTPCDPCHTGPHPYGQKASDLTCIPLTREEHREYDADPRGFAEKHGLDMSALVKRLNRVWFKSYQEGA